MAGASASSSHLKPFSSRDPREGESQPSSPALLEQMVRIFHDMNVLEVEDERKVRLSSVLSRIRAKAIYTYDFGDGWEHAIVLEKVLPADPNATYPVCTDGELACPPEDCGGIPGFYDLQDAINDPNHEQHEELRDWVGGDYDPQAFSIKIVNRLLAPLRRTAKKAAPAAKKK